MFLNKEKFISIFLLIALLIILFIPFYHPGMYFSLDGSFNYKIVRMPINNLLYLFGSFLYFLNQFLDVTIIQKLLFFSIFFFLLVGSFITAPFKHTIAKLSFAGILTFNPFVYSRFLSGHYLVLLGYGLLIQLFLVSLKHENRKKYVFMSILLIFLMLTSIHYLFLGLIFMSIYLLGKLFLDRSEAGRNMLPLLIFLGFLVIFSLVAISNPNNLSGFMAFNQHDLGAFYTQSDAHLGLIPNLLSLFGFWNESENQFASLKDIIFFWPLITTLLIGLSILGFSRFIKYEDRDNKLTVFVFCVFTIFSCALALGIAFAPIREFTYALYERIRIMNILREPQKAVGVLALFYAFFTSYFIDNTKLAQKKYIFLIIIFAFIYYPAFVINFNKEIIMSNYPPEWFAAKEFLQHDKGKKYRVLVFPWHSYMPMSFANNKNIYNMSHDFFEKDMLTANNYEAKAVYTHDNSLEQMHVEGLLTITFEHKNLFGQRYDKKVIWGEALAPINVKYVMLLKESSWKRYQFLDKQEDLKKIYDNRKLIIYRNEKFQ